MKVETVSGVICCSAQGGSTLGVALQLFSALKVESILGPSL